MSYMKSINDAKSKSKTHELRSEYDGPLDVLIVSPVEGEPWFLYCLKSQISKHGAFETFKNFIKKLGSL